MVRRYKDLGRITTAPAQRTNYNINVPRNIGAEARINAIKQAGAEISSTLFNIAKDKAVIQAEEDSSKAQIQYINHLLMGVMVYRKAHLLVEQLIFQPQLMVQFIILLTMIYIFIMLEINYIICM